MRAGWLCPSEEEIEQRLRLGEDARTKFKGVARTGHRADPHGLAKAIAAMANTEGGYVFLGVEDDGTPSGVGDAKQADDLMIQVTQICSDRINPPITCPVSKAEYRRVLLLIVQVPAFSPQRPYQVDGKFYRRYGSRSDEATRDDLLSLLQSADYHYDDQTVRGATRDDLDRGAVDEFFSEAYGRRLGEEDVARYLHALKCTDPDGSPTVAGILCFGVDPSAWLPDARITAVRFPGTEMGGEFADSREIRGRLPEQLEAAAGFLDAHVGAPSRVQGWDRKAGGIPRPAMREALRNAVIHRDYRATSQVRVFVFDDRVEIINPGTLLNRLTLDSIRIGGISQRRNPAICAVLNRLNQVENIGMGVPPDDPADAGPGTARAGIPRRRGPFPGHPSPGPIERTMTGGEESAQAWWQRQPQGAPILLAFVKIDRAGSTAEWAELPPEEVRRRRQGYFGGVTYVARSAKAAEPLHWQGDGVMLFLAGDEAHPAPVQAFAVAKLLWQRVRIDLNFPARIAIHAAEVPWNADTGQLSHPAIDLCGHLEQAAPVNGVIVSEDVYLSLPEDDRRELAPLGVTARDGVPAYVFPAGLAARKDPDAFQPGDEQALWADFRHYVNSPEVRRLRYVGFRLVRKEPPSLDILRVFVPLTVERRRRDLGLECSTVRAASSAIMSFFSGG